MITPHTRYFIQKGLHRMGMGRGEQHAKIRANKHGGERGKGQRNQDKLHGGRTVCKGHSAGGVFSRAKERDKALRRRGQQRQYQKKMSKLSNHRPAIGVNAIESNLSDVAWGVVLVPCMIRLRSHFVGTAQRR